MPNKLFNLILWCVYCNYCFKYSLLKCMHWLYITFLHPITFGLNCYFIFKLGTINLTWAQSYVSGSLWRGNLKFRNTRRVIFRTFCTHRKNQVALSISSPWGRLPSHSTNQTASLSNLRRGWYHIFVSKIAVKSICRIKILCNSWQRHWVECQMVSENSHTGTENMWTVHTSTLYSNHTSKYYHLNLIFTRFL